MSRKLIAFLNAYTQGITGGDVRFIRVAQRLEGFALTVVTSSLGRRLCQEEGLVADYVLTSTEETFRNTVATYLVRSIKGMRLRLEFSNQDVLYSTSDFLPDVLPAFLHRGRRRDKTRWVAVIHHRYDAPWRRKGARVASALGYVSQRLSFRLIAARADAIFVLKSAEGEEIRRLFANRGFAGKVRMVENGVDVTSLRNLPSGRKEYEACFVASLRRSKGLLDLVEIWRQVCSRHADARLVVVGSGDEKLIAETKALIGSYGLSDNVILAGFVPEAEKARLLKASRLFVSPSYEEGWGIAICEAMACGLPVVAWDLPAYRTLYHQGMLTADVGNMSEFADRVIDLLGDPELLTRMSREATEVGARYDWGRIAERELEALRAL